MSRQEKENTYRKIKRVIAAAMVGLAVYFLLTLAFSSMALSKKISEEIICNYGSETALFVSSLISALIIKTKGKGRLFPELFAASLLLWGICAAMSLMISESVSIISMIISVAVCLAPIPFMSIAKCKNSKLHKRRAMRS